MLQLLSGGREERRSFISALLLTSNEKGIPAKSANEREL